MEMPFKVYILLIGVRIAETVFSFQFSVFTREVVSELPNYIAQLLVKY
jgi:hypothetical protein